MKKVAFVVCDNRGKVCNIHETRDEAQKTKKHMEVEARGRPDIFPGILESIPFSVYKFVRGKKV